MCWSTVISVICIMFTGLATGFIAYYARESNRLASEIQKLNTKHSQELSDLYQAIVIATMLSDKNDKHSITLAIDVFKKHYNGSVEIFKSKD